MSVVIFCSFLALILTYLESLGKIKNGMKYGFFIVTFLGCIHYDYGNDYMSYYEMYKRVTSFPFDLKGIMAGDYYHESGWVLLNWAFKPIGGFFVLVAVLNVFQNWIIFNTIRREVDKKWYPFAVFIYLFNSGYYLMSFTMMRQMLVAVIFLGLWPYIQSRRWWIPIGVLYLCSFIHSSAIILLPFAFWGFVPLKNGKFIGCLYAAILVLLWFAKDLLNQLFMYSIENINQMSKYVDTYGSKMNQGLKLGAGFIIGLIPVILSIQYLFRKDKYSTKEKRQLVALGAVSSMIVPFASIIQMAGRLTTYFGLYTIASYPIIYQNIKNKTLMSLFVGLAVVLTLYSYFTFFMDKVWTEKFSEFHTIFSQL